MKLTSDHRKKDISTSSVEIILHEWPILKTGKGLKHDFLLKKSIKTIDYLKKRIMRRIKGKYNLLFTYKFQLEIQSQIFLVYTKMKALWLSRKTCIYLDIP